MEVRRRAEFLYLVVALEACLVGKERLLIGLRLF